MWKTVLSSAALRPANWMQFANTRALAAALGLIVIQVGIGVIMKFAQNGGSYSFSPSASVSISEFLKMLLSSTLFYRECRKRVAKGVWPKAHGQGSSYLPLASNESMPLEGSEAEDGAPGAGTGSDAGYDSAAPDKDVDLSASSPKLNLTMYWRYLGGDVTKEKQHGFYILALCYALINNSIFVSYKLADPGTIQLTKSGGTLITALVMVVSLNAAISKVQWIAIVIQLFGLILTQYHPETGSAYPFSTYMILLLQVFLSASSGVYNQYLLKTTESSLHADNMALYAAGTVINVVCHLAISVVSANEPGFFEGYNSIGAVMVVLSNVFIGLAITAVYKYADAVIKCLATAVATGILLYVSTILFGTQLGSLVVPGTIVVFFASWLYLAHSATPEPANESTKSSARSKLPFFTPLGAVIKKYPLAFLGTSTALTILIVAFLTMFKAKMPDFPNTPKNPVSANGSVTQIERSLISPL